MIAIATQKGGTGKSTLAVHLAVRAMQSAKTAQVVLLDLDPQSSMTMWALQRALDDPVVLSATPARLPAYVDQAWAEGAAFVFIHTPPQTAAPIRAAIEVADLVLIPIRPGPFDIRAAAGTVSLVRRARRPSFFVLSQVPGRGPDADDAAAVLTAQYPDIPVAPARIGQRKAFMQALISGQAVTEIDPPSSKAAQEIDALFRAVQKALGR